MEEHNKANVNHKAVALKYSPADIAPKIVAKGKGYMAERILKNAGDNDVKVYKDDNLVNELSKIEIGSNIPPDLYEVVAQVLVFIDKLDRLEEYRKREK